MKRYLFQLILLTDGVPTLEHGEVLGPKDYITVNQLSRPDESYIVTSYLLNSEINDLEDEWERMDLEDVENVSREFRTLQEGEGRAHRHVGPYVMSCACRAYLRGDYPKHEMEEIPRKLMTLPSLTEHDRAIIRALSRGLSE